ncbi:hypothetical protein G3480_25610 [Thiorhodococcus mannitoliphagus]|uniref:Uncharacterized protein n=1 Tax=Thiorhodococcus mannitoliphagus TaxID=329406 RepID=A0A6P1E2N3_9GAMM|nr:hypothetical protein [Thiorhodococcus mannitoliphagus]NEX23611.1 hypothetical protein [Thiorhodococcus mannitoliphagus]
MSVHHNIEDACRAWNAWTHLAARFTAVGMIGFGCLVFSGNYGISDEIPSYVEIGVAIIVFGVLMFIGLSGKGGIFDRVKNLIVSFLLGGFAAAAGLVTASSDTWYAQLGYGALTLMMGIWALERLWAALAGKPALK